MPVRSVIHWSDVSTIFSRSKLVSTFSGSSEPVPNIPTASSIETPQPILAVSRLCAGRLPSLCSNTAPALYMSEGGCRQVTLNLLVHLALRKLGRDANGVLDGVRVGATMANDAHAAHPQQSGPAVLRIVHPLLKVLEGPSG